MNTDIMWGSIAMAVIVIGFMFAYWYDVFRKPKSKVPICVKCRYCIKTGWWSVRRITCRTPNDPTSINYITGKKAYPTYSCFDRNYRGTCLSFKKVWWRR